MNRLFLPCVAAVIMTMSLSSCIKNTQKEASPVQSGVNIYNWFDIQNSISNELANVAFRFNILLAEADKQGVELDKAVVTIDGVANQNLKSRLFGSGYATTTIIMDPSQLGLWKITYPTAYSSTNDVEKKGTVYIETGDKLLSDDDATWKITPESDNDAMDRFSIKVSNSTIFIDVTETYKYEIINVQPNTWVLSVNNFVCYENIYSTPVKSDWRSTFNITKKSADPAPESIYTDFVTSTLEVTGSAGGKRLADNLDFSYYINDALRYKQSCRSSSRPSALVSGDESVTLNTNLGSSEYPSDQVRIVRTNTQGCTTTITVIYNGITETIQ